MQTPLHQALTGCLLPAPRCHHPAQSCLHILSQYQVSTAYVTHSHAKLLQAQEPERSAPTNATLPSALPPFHPPSFCRLTRHHSCQRRGRIAALSSRGDVRWVSWEGCACQLATWGIKPTNHHVSITAGRRASTLPRLLQRQPPVCQSSSASVSKELLARQREEK